MSNRGRGNRQYRLDDEPEPRASVARPPRVDLIVHGRSVGRRALLIAELVIVARKMAIAV